MIRVSHQSFYTSERIPSVLQWPDRLGAQLGYHGDHDGRKLERDQSPAPKCGGWGPGELGRLADPAWGSAATHGRLPTRPAAPGPHRPPGRRPGGVPGSLRAPDGVLSE